MSLCVGEGVLSHLVLGENDVLEVLEPEDRETDSQLSGFSG